MIRLHVALFGLATLLVLASAAPARAQDVTLPPSGDNQKCTAIQHIGPATDDGRQFRSHHRLWLHYSPGREDRPHRALVNGRRDQDLEW